MRRSLINGVESAQVALSDRGFNYGDGVFETILVADGRPVWWEAHEARLRRGAAALKIAAPAADLLYEEARTVCEGVASGVLKLVLTRGESGRGYAGLAAAEPTRALSLHPLPERDAGHYHDGVAVRWCDMRLAIQPQLAGLKHLNRLEQVLARAEWQDEGATEGLLRDTEGRVVCAIAANLFVVRAGRVVTPTLERCGVAGVTRAWVQRQVDVETTDLGPADVEAADELFLTSSLRGILPIARLDGRRWKVGPVTRGLQQTLWREVPALHPESHA